MKEIRKKSLGIVGKWKLPIEKLPTVSKHHLYLAMVYISVLSGLALGEHRNVRNLTTL